MVGYILLFAPQCNKCIMKLRTNEFRTNESTFFMWKIISSWKFPCQITCLYSMVLGDVFANAICGCDHEDDEMSCVREMMQREHSFLFLTVISKSVRYFMDI